MQRLGVPDSLSGGRDGWIGRCRIRGRSLLSSGWAIMRRMRNVRSSFRIAGAGGAEIAGMFVLSRINELLLVGSGDATGRNEDWGGGRLLSRGSYSVGRDVKRRRRGRWEDASWLTIDTAGWLDGCGGNAGASKRKGRPRATWTSWRVAVTPSGSSGAIPQFVRPGPRAKSMTAGCLTAEAGGKRGAVGGKEVLS